MCVGEMLPPRPSAKLQSAVPDASAGCGGVHDPRPAVGGNPLGFAEYSVGVALKRDVERAHPLVSRVLLKRDDGAADGQVRVFLQYEPNSIPSVQQLGQRCFGRVRVPPTRAW